MDENGGAARSDAALSVSGAMALAKGALEGVVVRMVGEVSEVSVKAGYKAAYFTVKDKDASLPCMMWNSRYQASGVQLRVGMLVELTGRFTLYAAKGRMNFDAFSISLAGEGNLRMQVANLAKALQAEGLMDPSRKVPLPAYPEVIGVVTSPRGAAVHDVLRTLRRRYPVAKIVLAGVPVEGAQAAAGIVDGMRKIYAHGADVMLVVRGGGSFEDLMPFNDEALARAIAACPIPVVTGIGHEPDTTIADMVADLRASTPTAAAESIVPDKAGLDARLEAVGGALTRAARADVERRRFALSRIASKPLFEDPMRLFEDEAQTLDFLTDRMLRVGDQMAVPFENQLGMAAARLHDLSPLAVLGRGYAIARDGAGAVVRSASGVSQGDVLNVSVSDGTISCEVVDTMIAEQTA